MSAEKQSSIRIVEQQTVWKRFIHLRTIVLEQTRADGPGHNRELNPIYTYVDPSVARIGGAAEQTRADQPSGNRELIPVERWTA